MKFLAKTPIVLALAATIGAAAMTPSFAQHRWHRGDGWAAAGAGFAAGALVGAAAANAAAAPNYYYRSTDGYALESDSYYGSPTYGTQWDNVGSPNYNPYVCTGDEGYGRRSTCDTR
ncbi:MAG: hypothetical protein AB7K04_01445 [Pseudorhodoplanes sp.]